MKPTFIHLFKARIAWLVIAGLMATLAACGGGTSVAGDPGSGGTGSYSSGAVSGFGSVILNDTRFADSAATVENEDGETVDADKGTLSTASLQMGMIVEVEGGTVTAATVSGGLATSTAEVIRITNQLLGPVDDFSSSSLGMLGQHIDVNAATVLEGVSSLAEANSSNCAYAEVYAYFNSATLRYAASRIACLSSQLLTYRLFGPVSSLDTSASTFSVNGLTVSYTGLTAPSGLANGATVRIRLANTWTSGTAAATRLAVRTKTVQSTQSATVEGLITHYTSKFSFTVNGVPVVATSSTEFETEALGNGSRVKVEGKLSNGQLLAQSVEEISDSDLEDESQEAIGTISNLNTSAQTFTLTTSGGRSFSVDYTGVSDAPTLTDGATVEVEGKLASDGTTITATELELGSD